MKYIVLVSLLVLSSCTYNDMHKFFADHPEGYDKFFGEFDYSKEQNESAHNKFGYEFKKPIHETEDKKRLYYFGGSVYHNYDMFSKSYHINGFGQVGVDF